MITIAQKWTRPGPAAIGLVATWLAGSALLAFAAVQSRFNLSNIDGLSYISIARQYASGHLDSAMNAYWSPMVSWLMAPLIGGGVGEVLAFDLVSAAGASIAIGVSVWFVWRHTGGKRAVSYGVLLSLLVFALANLPIVTPDMLVVAWTVVFAVYLVELDAQLDSLTARARAIAGIGLGVVCAIGYFIKLYAVPVFVVTLVLWVIIRLLAARKQRTGVSLWHQAAPVAVALGGIVLALVVVATPWVASLSAKYGEFTVGSSASVNLESKFGDDTSSSIAGPVSLDAPPNEYALSFAEDRTPAAGATAKAAGSVAERLAHYAKGRVAAFPWYLNKVTSIAPFAVPTIALLCLLILFGYMSAHKNRGLVLVAVTWLVYFAGYAGVTTAARAGGNARYYWPLLVLSLMILALLVPRLWEFVSAKRQRVRSIAVLLVLLLVPFSVVWEHGLGRRAPFSMLPPVGGLSYLWSSPEPSSEQTFASTDLAAVIPAHSKLVGSNFRTSVLFAYYLELQVYGRSGQKYDPNSPALLQAMDAAGIDYFVQFTPHDSAVPDLSAVGTVIAEFTTTTSCSDAKGAQPEECVITIVKRDVR